MKTSVINLVIFLSFLLVLGSCDKEDDINLNVSAVKSLYEPANNFSVVLQTSASASLYFEWEPAKAEDGGMVLYEVVFDVEGGDFSDPVYRITSDNSGGYNHATITHSDLNKMGAQAGIASAATGKVIWTVVSSKGINEEIGEETRTLEITRLAGFAEIPVDVYITGEGSEAGADLADASVMKAVESGVFEIYTQLTAGSDYYFVDAATGTPRQFYVEDDVIKEGTSVSTVETTGVYRINLDFNTGAAVYTQIVDIELYFCPTDAMLFSHEYQGNGIWLAASQPITFKEESWGRDERYKFYMTTITSDGTTTGEWWGTANTTDGPPTGADEYYYLAQVPESQWDDKFKFDPIMDGALADVTVYFQASGPYTHFVEKVGDQ